MLFSGINQAIVRPCWAIISLIVTIFCCFLKMRRTAFVKCDHKTPQLLRNRFKSSRVDFQIWTNWNHNFHWTTSQFYLSIFVYNFYHRFTIEYFLLLNQESIAVCRSLWVIRRTLKNFCLNRADNYQTLIHSREKTIAIHFPLSWLNWKVLSSSFAENFNYSLFGLEKENGIEKAVKSTLNYRT